MKIELFTARNGDESQWFFDGEEQTARCRDSGKDSFACIDEIKVRLMEPRQ